MEVIAAQAFGPVSVGIPGRRKGFSTAQTAHPVSPFLRGHTPGLAVELGPGPAAVCAPRRRVCSAVAATRGMAGRSDKVPEGFVEKCALLWQIFVKGPPQKQRRGSRSMAVQRLKQVTVSDRTGLPLEVIYKVKKNIVEFVSPNVKIGLGTGEDGPAVVRHYVEPTTGAVTFDIPVQRILARMPQGTAESAVEAAMESDLGWATPVRETGGEASASSPVATSAVSDDQGPGVTNPFKPSIVYNAEAYARIKEGNANQASAVDDGTRAWQEDGAIAEGLLERYNSRKEIRMIVRGDDGPEEDGEWIVNPFKPGTMFWEGKTRRDGLTSRTFDELK